MKESRVTAQQRLRADAQGDASIMVADDWVKPTVKRMSLKDALQGSGNNSFDTCQGGSGGQGQSCRS